MARPALGLVVRRGIGIGTHVVVWTIGYFGAFLLRFDGEIPQAHRRAAVYGLFVLLAIRVSLFWISGLFHGLLRYAGLREVRSIVQACTAGTAIFVVAGAVIHAVAPPRSIYVGEWLLAILSSSGIRLGFRLVLERRRGRDPKDASATPALLIGAGDAGELFLRDLERLASPGMRIVGILDDDPAKNGSLVRGRRVLGTADEATVRKVVVGLDVRLVVLAMPTASGSRTREIVSVCQAMGVETKTLPSLQQIISGDVRVSMLRDVAIEDLLRREPIQLEEASMRAFLRGRRILVTGGAGSIGSELARQAATYEPAALGILDHNENALFFLQRELQASFPKVAVRMFLGDIKDPKRIHEVLGNFRPHVILHSAAHKHVPLTETNPAEAVKNNVFGTRIVADLANMHGCDAFVLISTDKAVNPTSVMGATKRIAEKYVQALSVKARTRFVAVRFGNVLGSAGSVVPIFREQIARGGPVTVTDPDMRRYFMTIPEAAQLVLQAGALAKGGEIFVLDMGEPVRIADLARDMIRMSGLRPEVDVPIVFTGRRPGEKLFEELLHPGEDNEARVHSKIFVGKSHAPAVGEMVEAMRLLASAIDNDTDELVRIIASIVPEGQLEAMPRSPLEAESERVLGALRGLATLTIPEVS
jgi:FlaA1/EpsC-like NDP-sugar epimerase